MPTSHPLGPKVRALRQHHGLTQAALARDLQISPSYLNLIEHGRRPLPAPLLLALVERFQLDLKDFAQDDTSQRTADVLEALGDPLFDSDQLLQKDVAQFSLHHPDLARAFLTLYRTYQASQHTLETLGERLDPDASHTLPSELVNDFFQHHHNFFPQLEQAAEDLARRAELDLDDLSRTLTRHLERHHDVRAVVTPHLDHTLRRFDPSSRTLELAESLAPRSRNFQLAHQTALLEFPDLLRDLARDPALPSDDAHHLALVVLANYVAGALLMPYDRVLAAAEDERYDIEVLGHRFRTSFEQVCHRLTTLRRPGREGVPFHMVRVDLAGNMSKRFSASGIRFARFSGACPRWNVHSAFLTPGQIRTQISETPEGALYFCLARTVRKTPPSFHARPTLHAIGLGCRIEHADRLVYAAGVDLHARAHVVEVGTSCRLCPRAHCEQRAFPAIQHRLHLDPHVQPRSPYTPR